jgi:hypothetical protein
MTEPAIQAIRESEDGFDHQRSEGEFGKHA